MKLHWNFAAFILFMHALNSFWFSTCFNDSLFCSKLHCSTKISFIFMPTLCSTRISKNLGQVSFFYYLGQDGIGQVVIWGKLGWDKLTWGKMTYNHLNWIHINKADDIRATKSLNSNEAQQSYSNWAQIFSIYYLVQVKAAKHQNCTQRRSRAFQHLR